MQDFAFFSRNMGEVDTKSIESVQIALSLFGEKSDPRKKRFTSGDVEKEREIESLQQDLANTKIQLEAKDSAYKQVLLDLNHHRKISDEAHTCVEKLESKIKKITDQLLEAEKIRIQLVGKEEELSAAQETIFELMKRAEMIETELKRERLKTEDLNKVFSEKEEQLKSAQEQLGKELEIMENERELEVTKWEKEEIRGRENEARVEIALLKSELHKGQSLVAAAEVAEAIAASEKSGLYRAVHQLALEAEEAKKEVRRLKQEAAQESEKCDSPNREFENALITISREEYEVLMKKVEEIGILKKELETAAMKIGEFRTRAEQAASRAEVVERAKLELEEKIRRWREQKQRRKVALAALEEESMSVEISSFKSKINQPLGKVLNMKF